MIKSSEKRWKTCIVSFPSVAWLTSSTSLISILYRIQDLYPGLARKSSNPELMKPRNRQLCRDGLEKLPSQTLMNVMAAYKPDTEGSSPLLGTSTSRMITKITRKTRVLNNLSVSLLHLPCTKIYRNFSLLTFLSIKLLILLRTLLIMQRNRWI